MSTTEALFDKIAAFIAESRELLEAGKMLELAGLDDHVHSLCEAVLQLSQDERLQYAGRLQHLLGELKTLGESMVEKRDAMAEEIRHMSHHKKASTAYRIVEASDAYKEED